MATNKATSAAPAASRTRAPQTITKAAVEGTQTRESRGPSVVIVPEAAKPLQPLSTPVISWELVYIATAMIAERAEEDSDAVIDLAEQFKSNDHYQAEHHTTLQSMAEERDQDARHFYLRLFAARIFRTAFLIGFYAGRGGTLKAISKGGPR